MSARAAVSALDSPDGSSRPERSAPVRRVTRTVAAVVAWLVQAILGVTVSVSGLIMPPSAVMLLGVFWIAGVVVMLRVRRRPASLFAVPVVSWVGWFAVAWLGEVWLGWKA